MNIKIILIIFKISINKINIMLYNFNVLFLKQLGGEIDGEIQ